MTHKAVDETRCPICGDNNQCGTASGKGNCWCFQQKMNPDLISWLQIQGIDDHCICPACAADNVRSPCVDVCALATATDICHGCYRSLDEIAAWSQMSPGARADVYVNIRKRREPGQQ